MTAAMEAGHEGRECNVVMHATKRFDLEEAWSATGGGEPPADDSHRTATSASAVEAVPREPGTVGMSTERTPKEASPIYVDRVMT